MLLFFIMPKSELDQNFSTTNVSILRRFPKDALIKSKAMGFISRQNDVGYLLTFSSTAIIRWKSHFVQLWSALWPNTCKSSYVLAGLELFSMLNAN